MERGEEATVGDLEGAERPGMMRQRGRPGRGGGTVAERGRGQKVGLGARRTGQTTRRRKGRQGERQAQSPSRSGPLMKMHISKRAGI